MWPELQNHMTASDLIESRVPFYFSDAILASGDSSFRVLFLSFISGCSFEIRHISLSR